jgi:hypothetical protein
MKTEFAGDVTISWDAVTAITSTTQLHFALKRRADRGRHRDHHAGGRFTIATKETGAVTAARDSVVASARSGAGRDRPLQQSPADRSVDRLPGFELRQHAWQRNTSTFSLSTNAIRATTRDKI